MTGDVLERRVGSYTVRIDRLLCVGFGDCIEAAPEVFAFDDDGIVRFVDETPAVERARLVHACDVCPVDALTVIDAAGVQLVP
ncbi:MAG: ferredoxin [Longimicrobiales bacterium]